MAHRSAVRESAPGACLTIAAGISFSSGSDGIADVGIADVVVDPDVLSMSITGLMLDMMVGSFAISSGFDKSEESMSPPEPLAEADDGDAGGAEIFCRIEASISS